jgi:hypothetical protein
MDTKIPPFRTDVVTVPSMVRPTPTPVRVSFGEILAKGAGTLVAGAQAAMEVLPGGSLIAAAIRGGGGSGTTTPMMSGSFNNGMGRAEGPGSFTGTSVGGGFGAGGAGGATSTSPATGSLDQSLQQSQEVNAQNQTFSTLSNVMKAEADTIKNAIGNLR